MYLHLLLKFAHSDNLKRLCNEGELYMGTLKSYRESDNSEVGDKNEGAHKVRYRSECKVSRVNSTTGKNEEIGILQDVIHREFNDIYEYSRVYCMYYAISPKDKVDKLSSIIDDQIIKKFEYDSVAVFFNLEAFYDRLDNHLENNGNPYRRGVVDYIDISETERNLTPFDKDLSFKHQNEFRVCVQNVDGEHAFITSIGDLSDISFVVGVKELDNILINIQDSQITFRKCV